MWTLILGLAVSLCAAGRLRSGVGILLQLCQDDGGPKPADEFHRPDLGGNETWLVLGGLGCWLAFPWLSPSSCPLSIFLS